MPEQGPVDPGGAFPDAAPGPSASPSGAAATAVTPSAKRLPAAPAEPEKDWTNEDPANDAAKAPKRERDPAYWADPAFFRLVILFAGWVLILAVGGMLLLAANDKDIPQGVVAVASGLVGLLTGIFAAKSSQR